MKDILLKYAKCTINLCVLQRYTFVYAEASDTPSGRTVSQMACRKRSVCGLAPMPFYGGEGRRTGVCRQRLRNRYPSLICVS